MKLLRSLPMRTLLVSAFIFFSSLTTSAQTANVPGRVTQAVDMENLVTLQGNTHPLARPEYDQGAAPDSLPMERMLLVLQRSAEQEAALRKLLDEQQIKSSPNYHMWLTPEQFGRAIRPRRCGYSGRNGLARLAGLSGQSCGSGPHRHRVFGHGGSGAPGLSHGDPQIRGQRRGALGQRERSADSCRSDAGGGRLCLAEQLPPSSR